MLVTAVGDVYDVVAGVLAVPYILKGSANASPHGVVPLLKYEPVAYGRIYPMDAEEAWLVSTTVMANGMLDFMVIGSFVTNGLLELVAFKSTVGEDVSKLIERYGFSVPCTAMGPVLTGVDAETGAAINANAIKAMHTNTSDLIFMC
jgi:hypothetical protein